MKLHLRIQSNLFIIANSPTGRKEDAMNVKTWKEWGEMELIGKLMRVIECI